jgi:hypothetical protein
LTTRQQQIRREHSRDVARLVSGGDGCGLPDGQDVLE